jgi:antitoxin MazE
MRVSKWGNSLAIRLRAIVVGALKRGGAVEARSDLDRNRERAIARMHATRWKLPPDYKFDRDEANSR